MNMEFMILQGNTLTLNTINYKQVLIQRERREVQSDITSVNEMMQEYEDNCDYVISDLTTTETNNFNSEIQRLQADTNTAYLKQQTAQTDATDAANVFNEAESNYNSAKTALETAKKNPDTVSDISDLESKFKKAEETYKKAKSAKEQADKALKSAQTEYTAKSTQNNTSIQTENTRHQNELQKIQNQKKTMKSAYEKAMKADLKKLNDKDARLELSLNELNTMAEMLKSEKESAQSAVEQQAQDLAPKYS